MRYLHLILLWVVSLTTFFYTPRSLEDEISITKQKPITEQQAALRAVTCFGWPFYTRGEASKLHRAKAAKKFRAMSFVHAQAVTIRLDGTCSYAFWTTVISDGSSQHFPPSS